MARCSTTPSHTHTHHNLRRLFCAVVHFLRPPHLLKREDRDGEASGRRRRWQEVNGEKEAYRYAAEVEHVKKGNIGWWKETGAAGERKHMSWFPAALQLASARSLADSGCQPLCRYVQTEKGQETKRCWTWHLTWEGGEKKSEGAFRVMKVWNKNKRNIYSQSNFEGTFKESLIKMLQRCM